MVTEAAGGVQIINLTNPDQPVFVKTWKPSGVNWGDSHNISLDTSTGIACVCGTSGGAHFFDVSKDPVNPTFISTYTGGSVHDLQMQDGVAHLAMLGRGIYRQLDITKLPVTSDISSLSISRVHTSWPSRDNQFVIATSETKGGGITIVDNRNPAAPQSIATWFSGTGTSVHNAFMRDRVGYMSYYAQGFRSLDLSDPFNPVDVGFYDTSTLTGVYDGAWGCYPFQPSGIVYISDRQKGLHILKPKSTTEAYGAASPGTAGIAPTMHTFGAAWVGNANFALEIDDAQPNRAAFVLLGTQRTAVSAGGLTILVDTLTAPGVVLSLQTDSSGQVHTAIPIPNNAALSGLSLHAQGFVMDAGGPHGVAASRGKSFEVFVR